MERKDLKYQETGDSAGLPDCCDFPTAPDRPTAESAALATSTPATEPTTQPDPRTALQEAFDRYVSGYDADNPRIRLKILHTRKVAGLCWRIAEAVASEWGGAPAPSDCGATSESDAGSVPPISDAASAGNTAPSDSNTAPSDSNTAPSDSNTAPAEGCAPPDPLLAWKIGMLHDIGRFEQERRYGTFIDADSVPHAEFGADLLFREGLLEQLAPGLTPSEQRLMEVSIRSHSAYRLPDTLTAEERMYCNILRDADKIDIFRVFQETPLEDVYNVTREELEHATVSDDVKACFRSKTSVLRSLKKTPADFLVGHICLCFELVYPVSRQIASDQGCLDKLLEFQSRNPETAAWFDFMRKELSR